MVEPICPNKKCPQYSLVARCYEDIHRFCHFYEMYKIKTIEIPDEDALRLIEVGLLHPSDLELETISKDILDKCRKSGL